MHRRDALKAHRGTGHLLGCPMDFNGDNILSSYNRFQHPRVRILRCRRCRRGALMTDTHKREVTSIIFFYDDANRTNLFGY